MGGQAFAHAAAEGEPTLNTPRLSPDDYSHLKNIYIRRLSRECFPGCTVAALVEAPEKTDYGDIDLKIQCDETNIDFVKIADQLGAAGIICLSYGIYQKCTIAVPVSGDRCKRPVVKYKVVHSNKPNAQHKPSAAVTEEAYAQIDIEVLPAKMYEWDIFYQSYGDMSSLLGRMISSLGFTVSDKGVSLRLQELDDAKSNPQLGVAEAEGMLLLSNDPAQVMQFLGLSVDRFELGFDRMQDFYEWLAHCRLLCDEAIMARRNLARERKRDATRSAYAMFFDEYLPRHRGLNIKQEHETEEETTARKQALQAKRKQWREVALDEFGKHEEFDRMHSALLRKIQNQIANHLLKPMVAKHSGKTEKGLNEAVRAFRRWAGCRGGRLYVLDVPHDDKESELHLLLGKDNSLQEQEAVNEWVKDHWEELRSLERQRLKPAE